MLFILNMFRFSLKHIYRCILVTENVSFGQIQIIWHFLLFSTIMEKNSISAVLLGLLLDPSFF